MFRSAPGRTQTLDQRWSDGVGDIETMTATDPLGSSTEFVTATMDEGTDAD